MLATDVATRGLDYTHQSHVINYDFPANRESYTHRTGRTARMGHEGIAMTFYTRGNLRDLAAVIKTNHIEPIWEGTAPDLKNISGRKRPQARRGPKSSSNRRHKRPAGKTQKKKREVDQGKLL